MDQATIPVKKISYTDISLFLLLIPFINVINYYLTYDPIKLNWRSFITFSVDTIEGYIAWLGLRIVIIFLDKKLPYQTRFLKRLFIQLIFTTIIGLGIIILLTELVNWVATSKPVPFDFYKYDVLIFFIWILVVNGIYIGIYFFKHWQESEKEKNKHAILLQQEILLRQEESRIRQNGFLVKIGNQSLNLIFNEITGIYIDGDYTIICTLNDKKYFLDQSLDALEKTLPSEWFFRISRQYILHRQSIKGFRRIENGKLDILLHSSILLPESINISRLRTPIFKEWFNNNK